MAGNNQKSDVVVVEREEEVVEREGEEDPGVEECDGLPSCQVTLDPKLLFGPIRGFFINTETAEVPNQRRNSQCMEKAD